MIKSEKSKKVETRPKAGTLDSGIIRRRWSVPIALVAIVLVGAYFRLADLGLAAFRGDEGFFLRVCHSKLSPSEIFGKWMELQGLSGQFPFSAAFTKWFVDTFHLTVNHVSVHLPSAIWGIVTILAAYGAGQAFAGAGFGLALAWILALNPFHIQTSREAYHYAPLLCGSFLSLWTALWMADHFQNGKPIGPLFYAVTAVGFFLLTYSQPSGWPLAFLVVLTVLYGCVRQLVKHRKLSVPYPYLLAIFLIIGLPLLLCDWGLKQQIQGSTPEMKAAVAKIFGVNPFWPALWRVITSFGWGNTPLRGLFTVCVLCLGIGVSVRKFKTDKRFLLIWLFLLIAFAFAIYSLRIRGTPITSRYVAALLPLYLTILVSGILFAHELFRFSNETANGSNACAAPCFLGSQPCCGCRRRMIAPSSLAGRRRTS